VKKNKDDLNQKIEVVYVPIDELIPAEYNPRKLTSKQEADISASILNFGFVDPIIVNKNESRKMVIIGGHQRVAVAKTIGIKEVPCVFVDVPVEKERELNIRLNKNTGEWDFELLEEFFDKGELLEFGFEEIDFGVTEIVPYVDTNGDDEVPEFDDDPKTVLGDIYELGPHRLVCGDSTIQTVVDTCLQAETPYLMVTDPPYGVEYDPAWMNAADRSNGKKLGDRATGKVDNDDIFNWEDAWTLSPSSVAYVYHAGKYAVGVADSLTTCGFEIRSQIIWNKNNFAISRGDYHWKHEPCWYAVKKGSKSNWNGGRSQTTVWDIDKPMKSETGHGTQKPIDCMLTPINNHTGDVYDPFCGSGTTLIACEKARRKCYAIELSPKYCDVIVKRYVDFCKKNNRDLSVKRNGEECNDFYGEEVDG